MEKREKKEKAVTALFAKVGKGKEKKSADKAPKKEKVSKGKSKFVLGIREKLILTSLVPIVFIVLLGSISYSKSADAIGENYEISMNNAIIKTGEYFTLLFGNLDDVNYSFYNQDDLIGYYSGTYKNDPTAEVTAYKDLVNRVKKEAIGNDNS